MTFGVRQCDGEGDLALAAPLDRQGTVGEGAGGVLCRCAHGDAEVVILGAEHVGMEDGGVLVVGDGHGPEDVLRGVGAAFDGDAGDGETVKGGGAAPAVQVQLGTGVGGAVGVRRAGGHVVREGRAVPIHDALPVD